MSIRPSTTLKTVLGLSLGVLGLSALALGDWHGDDEDSEGWGRGTGGSEVAVVDNALYQQECGACHLAYQPGLLPARSWQRVMAGLDDHFGDNAELDAADAAALSAWLQAHAADRADGHRSRAIAASIPPDEAPLRISSSRYFLRQHDEIPARLVGGNPEVGSFSACQSCHVGAERGRFDDDDVRIAGFGRWED